MKFCSRCGTQLNETALFCPGCGTPVAQAAPVPVEEPIAVEEPTVAEEPIVVEEPTQAAEPVPACVAPQKKKFLLPLILGGVALLLIAAIVTSIILSNIMIEPIKTHMDVYYGFAYSKIEDLAPKEYWDAIKEENPSFSIEKAIAKHEKSNKSELDLMEDLYGNDIKFSYVITKYTPMSKEMLRTIADCLDDKYDIDADSVKRGCQVWMDYTLKGESYTQSYKNLTVMLLKIEDKWYSITLSTHDGELIVNFDLPYYIQTYISGS